MVKTFLNIQGVKTILTQKTGQLQKPVNDEAFFQEKKSTMD